VIFLIGLTFFVIASCSAAFIPSSPFQSPFSHFISFFFDKIFPEGKWRLVAIGVTSAATAIMTSLLVAFKGSTYQLLIFFPIMGVFAVAGKPEKYAEDSPLRYGPPELALLGGFTVFIPIAFASYFSDDKDIYIPVSSAGVALLAGYGYGMYKLTRKVPDTLEVEAIAWLLESSQESSLFEKATGVASTPQRKVLLLDTLLSLLPHIIASHRRYASGEYENSELKLTLSCLAHLSTFTQSEGSLLRNRAALKRPALPLELRGQLDELRKDSEADPHLRDAAEDILYRFDNGIESEKQADSV
jgi:hypothetical protein